MAWSRRERRLGRPGGPQPQGELQGGVSFTLPANLAGEAHAFFSEDRLHDAGYAQLCLEMLMQKRITQRKGHQSVSQILVHLRL